LLVSHGNGYVGVFEFWESDDRFTFRVLKNPLYTHFYDNSMTRKIRAAKD